MIQFNLLPDVKINYLKARSFKRKILSVSLIVMAFSVGLVLFVFIVQLGQKKYISDLTKDIASEKSAIEAYPDINKVLTIQNQLNQLPSLHSQKPLTSRLFDYVNKVTPIDVSLNSVELDVATTTINLTGTAPNLEAVNRYVDTLKFATYKTDTGEGKPFKNVATTLSRSAQNSTFSVNITYDPIIFNRSENVAIVIPSITTTRSETEKPTQLFQQSTNDNGGQQ